MNSILNVNNLFLKKQDTFILQDINLQIKPNSLNIIIGPNGAGKSTFLNTLMGIVPEDFTITGKVTFNNIDISDYSINEKAKIGIFLSFQNPVDIPGLQMLELIKKSVKSLYPEYTHKNIIKDVKSYIDKFGLPSEMINWELNNLSGGQKKLSEALQMLLLKPKLILLDEIDSGLDFDKMKIISNIINYLKEKGSTIILVSHHHAISDNLKIDNYILLKNGSVQAVGGVEILQKVKKIGYE